MGRTLGIEELEFDDLRLLKKVPELSEMHPRRRLCPGQSRFGGITIIERAPA